MLRPRVMPALLLERGSLVKTIKFRDASYVGDPVNAIHIYNEMEVDELVVLDIAATIQGQSPPFELLRKIASECFMPVAYGGGIRTLDDIRELFALGIEKVSVNTRAVEDPALIAAAAERFGSQAIVVSIDAKLENGRYVVYTHGGRTRTTLDPVAHAKAMEQLGAGEVLITSIDRDGTMQGYDLALIRSVVDAVGIPVIALGGAGSIEHLESAVKQGGAAAAAAGAMFVYFGRNRAVLINFPGRAELDRITS